MDHPQSDHPAARALLDLAERGYERKKAAQIRELMPFILLAKMKGVSERKIVETLCANQLDVSIHTFKSVLYRVRKEKKLLSCAQKPAQSGPTEIHASAATTEVVAADANQNKDEVPTNEPSAQSAAKGGAPAPGLIRDKRAMEKTASKYVGHALSDFDVNSLLKKDLK